MSRFPYDDWERVTWNDRNGVDVLTPKGFTMARVRLQDGVYVDVYNLHTQAQTADADLAARRKNILQLIGTIESVSAGRAVIVMGDTNTRYT
jgi:endonuclease/exonuclease/phosphatase (EEP) superfamily protein YafD